MVYEPYVAIYEDLGVYNALHILLKIGAMSKDLFLFFVVVEKFLRSNQDPNLTILMK